MRVSKGFLPEPVNFRGPRLQAARILAGLVSHTEGAKVLRVQAEKYYYCELGIPATESVLRRAAAAYGVSPDYLLNSSADNTADLCAYLLAHAIVDYQNPLPPKQRADYLKVMRVSAGFATLDEAAAANGFNPMLAKAHEFGLRLPTAAELACYALAYNWDPIEVLANEELVTEAPYWERHYPEEFVSGRWGVRHAAQPDPQASNTM